jgi:hypothetical protein
MLPSGWRLEFCITNTHVVITKFLYDHILSRFGCAFTIVTNQSTHFIKNVIRYLIDQLILKHTNSTIYYPQAKSTNKIFGTLFTKMVNENHNNEDEHLSTNLFSYKTTILRLEGVTLHFNLSMDYTYYYL